MPPRATDSRSFSFLAEAVAAFAIVFILTAGRCAPCERVGSTQLALAVGAVTTAVLSGTIPRSPGLANPVVIISLASIGRLGFFELLKLLAAQLVGGAVGAMAGRTTATVESYYLARGGTPIWNESISWSQAALIEFVCAFLLLWSLLGTTGRDRGSDSHFRKIWLHPFSSAMVSGLLSAAFMLVGEPFTRGIANPICAFGPAVAGQFWDGQLLYWLAPLAGGWLAAVLHNVWFRPRLIGENATTVT